MVYLYGNFPGFVSAHAQALPPGMSKQVDKAFEKWDKQDSPGCALGVYKDRQIIYKRGYGMADLNNDVPITLATVFHVASMSKQFTAASIVLLAHQGKSCPWTTMCINIFRSCLTLACGSQLGILFTTLADSAISGRFWNWPDGVIRKI